MTDVSSKPLAGFKTTARVRGTVISTLNSQLISDEVGTLSEQRTVEARDVKSV
ncbi:MAG: hypothetical protein LBD53_03400 [Tannerella sp.]|nr:hypothetical protein [Tannerella sp.]